MHKFIRTNAQMFKSHQFTWWPCDKFWIDVEMTWCISIFINIYAVSNSSSCQQNNFSFLSLTKTNKFINEHFFMLIFRYWHFWITYFLSACLRERKNNKFIILCYINHSRHIVFSNNTIINDSMAEYKWNEWLIVADGIDISYYSIL